jgi:hypothetical protein
MAWRVEAMPSSVSLARETPTPAGFRRGSSRIDGTGQMSNGRNKYQSRDNRARVRAILLNEWDPIGVREFFGATDEYDSYADRAYVMLMDERADAAAIASYLLDVATERMGLRDPELPASSRRVAEMLVNLRPEFELH